MNKIYIQNCQDKFEVTQSLRGLVRRAVGQALKYEKFPFDAEVSVTLLSWNVVEDEENPEVYRIKDASPALFEILPSISWTFKF